MLRRTGVKKYIIVATYSILLYLGLSNISEVMSALRYAFGIISPIITGICIAFVVNILMRFVENRVLAGMGKKRKKLLKYKRMCSMLITYVSVLAFIVAISLFIGPQIGKALQHLSQMRRDILKMCRNGRIKRRLILISAMRFGTSFCKTGRIFPPRSQRFFQTALCIFSILRLISQARLLTSL